MADREVDFLLIGGGMASAHCASELRRRGAEGSILLVGREPEPPYERPPISKEYLRGDAGREDAHVNGGRSWYEENGVELLTGKNVMALDVEARTAKIQGGEEVGLRQGAARHRGDGQHPPRRGRRERGHPLPARLRQRRRDPRRRREGRARGPGRRQLHRLRGRRLADRAGHEVHDRRDGGGGALADLRRRRRALVPGAAGSQRRDLPRRRDAERLRGRRPGERGGLRERPGGRVRRGRGRRRGQTGRDARPAGRDRGRRRRHRLRLEARDLGSGDLRGRRLLLATRASSTAAASTSSTGTWRCSRAATSPATCSATTPTTRSCRTSSATSPTGPASSTSARRLRVGPRGVWRGDRESGEFSVWYLQGDRVAGCLSVGRSEELAEARQMIADGTPFS